MKKIDLQLFHKNIWLTIFGLEKISINIYLTIWIKSSEANRIIEASLFFLSKIEFSETLTSNTR